MAFGVTAYLLGKQGVNYALSCCSSENRRISTFMSSPAHLEELLYSYKEAIESGEPRQSFYQTLSDTASVFTRHMVMVIITDAEGLAELDMELVRRLIYYNDVYIFKIEDALLTSDNVYDLDAGVLADPFLALCKDLREEEKKMKENLDKAADRLLTPNRVFFKSVSREEEIVDVLIGLFGMRKGIL